MSETTDSTPEKPKKTVEDYIVQILESHRRETERVTRLVMWMRSHKEQIEKIGMTPVPYLNYVDFNNPDRAQVLEIIKAFPGTWTKSQNKTGDRPAMDYERQDESGLMLRIWAGALPPTCRVIEEEVEVPAQRVKRTRIECKPVGDLG